MKLVLVIAFLLGNLTGLRLVFPRAVLAHAKRSVQITARPMTPEQELLADLKRDQGELRDLRVKTEEVRMRQRREAVLIRRMVR